MTTRIIICRHGNTFDKGDVVTRVGARTDLPLSHSGRAQAEQLGTFFRPANSSYTFERAYCSDLRRTRETALKILENHPAALSEKTFLREIDYGSDENRPEAEVVDRVGRQAIIDWDTRAIVPDGWHVNPDKIREDWRKFFADMSKVPGDVLVVTSNGIARFCLDAADNITCEKPPLKLSTAAYGIIECARGESTITAWNLKVSER